MVTEIGRAPEAFKSRPAMGVCGISSNRLLSDIAGVTVGREALVSTFASFCCSLIHRSGIAVSGEANSKSRVNGEPSIGVSRTGGNCERLLVPEAAVTAERGVEPEDSLVPESQAGERRWMGFEMILRSPKLFNEDPDFLPLENNNRSEGRLDLLFNIWTPLLGNVGDESSSLG